MSASEITPIDRPCVNPLNRPIVLVLSNLGLVLARTPRVLGDVARAICRATEELSEHHRERIALELEQHAREAHHAATEVRTKGRGRR